MRPSDCEDRYSQVTITSAPTLFEPLTFRRIHTPEPRKLLSAPVCRSHNASTTPRALSSFSELIDGATLPYAACIQAYARFGEARTVQRVVSAERTPAGVLRLRPETIVTLDDMCVHLYSAANAHVYAHTQLCTRRAVHVENNSAKSRRDPLYPIPPRSTPLNKRCYLVEEGYRWNLWRFRAIGRAS